MAKKDTTVEVAEKATVIKYAKDDFVTDLQAKLAADHKLQVTKENLSIILNSAGDIITKDMTASAAQNQAEIQLILFNATFKAQFHPACTSKNPKTGDVVEVPNRTQVKFSTERKNA